MIDTLSAKMMSDAIECAVKSAESGYGYRAAEELKIGSSLLGSEVELLKILPPA